MVQFECEKCGACCRAHQCDKLIDNLCSVYEDRPQRCRPDVMYTVLGIDKKMDKEEYFKLSKVFCRYLRAKEEMEEATEILFNEEER